jgi:NAD(P)-dependent dehydrogenase (short-subunit alcohol dehydrogenase family)
MKKQREVILVTGASSGLGLAVSKYLAEKGYKVYAGARSFKAANIDEAAVSKDSSKSLEDKPSDMKGSLRRIYLDVTDQATVDNAIDTIKKEEGKIDVLVNCAAHLVLGAIEDTDISEYRGVIETNFLGTVRMCKAVAPVMRNQRDGLIINFSSINGVLGIPFQSAYVSSKFAIEGFTECLSLEHKEFGVKVAMIEPSDHRSGSSNYRPHAKKADLTDSPYYERFKTVSGVIHHDETNGSYPEDLANRIYKITLKSNPRLRYTVGKFDQRLSVLVKKIVPGRVFEKIIYGYYDKR